MGWFNDNHPCGEAYGPGGYMNPLPAAEPNPISRKVVHEVEAALKRQGSQSCGHKRGATLAQCHKCQAELRGYNRGLAEDPDNYMAEAAAHGGYGFDGAGRAEYEFDGSQDGSHAERQQPVIHTDAATHGSKVAEHWCAACDDTHPLARFSTFQLRRAGVPSDPVEFFEQQRERRKEAVLDSDDYQEAMEERREERREARRLKRRQVDVEAANVAAERAAAEAKWQAEEDAKPPLQKYEEQTLRVLQDFVAKNGGKVQKVRHHRLCRRHFSVPAEPPPVQSHLANHLAKLGPQVIHASDAASSRL